MSELTDILAAMAAKKPEVKDPREGREVDHGEGDRSAKPRDRADNQRLHAGYDVLLRAGLRHRAVGATPERANLQAVSRRP